jgi:hypothetical protein
LAVVCVSDGDVVGDAVVCVWLEAPLEPALDAPAVFPTPGGDGELLGGGNSGEGGPGLETGFGVGTINRWKIVGRSVVFEVFSLAPVPWRFRDAQIMTSFWSL